MSIAKIKIRLCLIWVYCKMRMDKLFSFHPRIILCNTPTHGNLGDQALTMAEYKFFRDFFSQYNVKELNGALLSSNFFNKKRLRCIIRRDDILIVNAGGFLGTLWPDEEMRVRKVLYSFSDRKLTIFPQTVYYSSDEFGKEQLKISQDQYNQCDDLTIFARESHSEKMLKEYFPKSKVFLAPDMVLYFDKFERHYSRKDVLLCLRRDKEQTQNYENKLIDELSFLDEEIKFTDTRIDHNVSASDRAQEVTLKLEEFSSAKLIITDRLHGMVFAALTQTPCIVMPSKSHKVKGVYAWIQNLNYIKLVENLDEFSNAVEQVLAVPKPCFDNTQLKKWYQKLADEINR